MTRPKRPSPPSPRRLILLGSTGSIGTNALEVVEHLHQRQLMRFEVVGLAAATRSTVQTAMHQ